MLTKHYNQLTPKQAELLAVMTEECGEAIQAVGKILRHGLDGTDPKTGVANQAQLVLELGDIVAVIAFLAAHGMIDEQLVGAAAKAKVPILRKRLHHYEEDLA